jgi:hypothetical protein
LFFVVRPVRFANDFQPETAFRAVVPVSEFFTDQYLKSGPVTPFDSVPIFANDAFENTSVVFVPTESRRFGVFRDRRV